MGEDFRQGTNQNTATLDGNLLRFGVCLETDTLRGLPVGFFPGTLREGMHLAAGGLPGHLLLKPASGSYVTPFTACFGILPFQNLVLAFHWQSAPLSQKALPPGRKCLAM